MSKLSKRNRIGKYQTPWGALTIPIEKAAELGLTTTSNPGSVGTLVRPALKVIPNVIDYLSGATFAASAPELSIGLPFAIAAASIGTEIYNRRHGLYPHQTSPYSTTSVYTPELSDATYVTIPRGISTGDYIYGANPLRKLGLLAGLAANAVAGGYNETRNQTQQTSPENNDESEENGDNEEGENQQGQQKQNGQKPKQKPKNGENTGNVSKSRTLAKWLIGLGAEQLLVPAILGGATSVAGGDFDTGANSGLWLTPYGIYKGIGKAINSINGKENVDKNDKNLNSENDSDDDDDIFGGF